MFTNASQSRSSAAATVPTMPSGSDSTNIQRLSSIQQRAKQRREAIAQDAPPTGSVQKAEVIKNIFEQATASAKTMMRTIAYAGDIRVLRDTVGSALSDANTGMKAEDLVVFDTNGRIHSNREVTLERPASRLSIGPRFVQKTPELTKLVSSEFETSLADKKLDTAFTLTDIASVAVISHYAEKYNITIETAGPNDSKTSLSECNKIGQIWANRFADTPQNASGLVIACRRDVNNTNGLSHHVALAIHHDTQSDHHTITTIDSLSTNGAPYYNASYGLEAQFSAVKTGFFSALINQGIAASDTTVLTQYIPSLNMQNDSIGCRTFALASLKELLLNDGQALRELQGHAGSPQDTEFPTVLARLSQTKNDYVNRLDDTYRSKTNDAGENVERSIADHGATFFSEESVVRTLDLNDVHWSKGQKKQAAAAAGYKEVPGKKGIFESVRPDHRNNYARAKTLAYANIAAQFAISCKQYNLDPKAVMTGIFEEKNISGR